MTKLDHERRQLTRLARLAALGVSALIAIGVLEGAARGIPLWPDRLSDVDPELGMAHIPGASGYWVNLAAPLEYRTWVEISEQGLRDRVYPYAKPPGTRRVLMLGDSLTEGLEVGLDQTFAKQLERDLTAGRPTEVINAGHYGYGTDQELLFFRTRGRRWQPDLVVLAFTPGNDVENNLSNVSIAPKPFFTLDQEGGLVLHPLTGAGGDGGQASGTKPGLVARAKSAVYDRSKLYRFVTFQVRLKLPGLHGMLKRTGLVGGGLQAAGAPTREEEAARLTDGIVLTSALLRQLQADVRDSGARLLVVVLPDPSQGGATAMGSGNLQAEGWPTAEGRGAAAERVAHIAQAIVAHCERDGIPVVDLFAHFRELAQAGGTRDLFYRLDGHLTSRGHEVVTAALQPAIEAQLP
jgi:lysophospholipase L1-like esterase